MIRIKCSSFPRRLESRKSRGTLDSRLRGNDEWRRNLYRLSTIPVTNGLIRRDASDSTVASAKVIDRVPLLEVPDHLLMVLVAMDFDGVVLD